MWKEIFCETELLQRWHRYCPFVLFFSLFFCLFYYLGFPFIHGIALLTRAILFLLLYVSLKRPLSDGVCTMRIMSVIIVAENQLIKARFLCVVASILYAHKSQFSQLISESVCSNTRLDAHLIDSTNWKYQCENCELLSKVLRILLKNSTIQIDPVIARVTDIFWTLCMLGKNFWRTYMNRTVYRLQDACGSHMKEIHS